MSAIKPRFVDFLKRCQNFSGGFGGGPQQLSHLAPSFAAVSALKILGALEVVDKESMHSFVLSLKQPDGSFCMHDGGESDLRAVYCAIVISYHCGFLDEEIKQGVVEFISRCQTFEGGYGGEPGNEAHGGYAFCAIAVLHIIGELNEGRSLRILDWAVQRQMSIEGGFQGRSNKLVDGCYSYWVGAIFGVISQHLKKGLLYEESMLQRYIIQACQFIRGGLIDKPGKYPDPYHTCYCLSGLSSAQSDGIVFGDATFNRVAQIDPIFNIRYTRLC